MIRNLNSTRTVFTLAAALIIAAVSPAQAPTSRINVSDEQRAQLHEIVARVLSHAEQVGCKPDHCKVLVTNFADHDGNTSNLGMQLAEEAGRDEAFTTNHIQVVPHSMLENYLENERIPSKSLREIESTRWLAGEFSANAALIGRIESKDGKLMLELQLVQ